MKIILEQDSTPGGASHTEMCIEGTPQEMEEAAAIIKARYPSGAHLDPIAVLIGICNTAQVAAETMREKARSGQ